MQRTLILLKPDCLQNKIVGQVISRFETKGYQIKATKMLQLDDGLLQEHYAHVADLPFFPEIASFMSSCPVIALILEGKASFKACVICLVLQILTLLLQELYAVT